MSTVEERFWAKVQGGDVTSCWIWKAAILHNGYGQFRANGVAMKAHRWAYETLRSEIPAGLVIDHLCRNRACVNPWHLDPVSIKTNVLRGVGHTARNATKTHCPQGHAYDEINTYTSPTGWRKCRECTRTLNAQSKRAKRATRKAVAS